MLGRMFRMAMFLAAVFVTAAFVVPGLTARFIDGPKAAATPTSAQSVSVENYGGLVRIPADRAGHYVTEAQINGRAFNIMVDTGASLMVLRYEDARALGVVYGSDKFDVVVQTANGTAKACRVKLYTVRLGSIALDDVDALVMEEGLLNTNLLGMSFLRRLSRYEVRGNTLILER
jgi:aspartyl protease family protein